MFKKQRHSKASQLCPIKLQSPKVTDFYLAFIFIWHLSGTFGILNSMESGKLYLASDLYLEPLESGNLYLASCTTFELTEQKQYEASAKITS